MPEIKCVLCGGTEFTKEEELFICKQCEAKYTLDEVKKLMTDISLESPKNDSAEIEKVIKNAMNTFDQNNYTESYRLFSEVLNMDPDNPTALLYRGLSAAWQTTVANSRYKEATVSAATAVKNASIKLPGDKYVAFLSDTCIKLGHLSLAMYNLADIYVLNCKNKIPGYGISGALIKSNTMSGVQNTATAFKLNVFTSNSEMIDVLHDAVKPDLPYSNDFHSNLFTYLTNAGKKLSGAGDDFIYGYKLINTILEILDTVNITTDNPDSDNLQRIFVSKLLNSSDLNTDERWNAVAKWANRYGIVRTQPTAVRTGGSTQKSGCYVATAVYGSYDCPEVWTLRRYRDNTLTQTWYGRVFIKTYYAISPTLVKWFGDTKWFKKMWQGKLDRMVRRLNDEGVENTPYEDKQW